MFCDVYSYAYEMISIDQPLGNVCSAYLLLLLPESAFPISHTEAAQRSKLRMQFPVQDACAMGTRRPRVSPGLLESLRHNEDRDLDSRGCRLLPTDDDPCRAVCCCGRQGMGFRLAITGRCQEPPSHVQSDSGFPPMSLEAYTSLAFLEASTC